MPLFVYSLNSGTAAPDDIVLIFAVKSVRCERVLESLYDNDTIGASMKTHQVSLAAAAMMALFAAGGIAHAADKAKNSDKVALAHPVSEDSLAAASERIHQTSLQIKADMEAAREARKKRAALEARLEAERKKEAELARQQAKKDAEELASTKEAKQRQALEVAQTKARREAAEREKKAERERQLALAEQRAEEEEAAKILEAKQRAALALKEALASSGPSFAEDPVSREQAQRARQEAKEKAAIALKKARESSGPGFSDGL
jgi:hypothetical protein